MNAAMCCSGAPSARALSLVVGFPAAPEPAPESPAASPCGSTPRRAHSLLSELLLASPPPPQPPPQGPAGGGAEGARPEEEDDDDDEAALSADDLDLLAELDSAWSSPSSSVFSRASSSRPIAIPAVMYFKDEAQRRQLDRLKQKRQWYSLQQEQERLLGKAGAKAATHHAPRAQPRHHKPGHAQQKC